MNRIEGAAPEGGDKKWKEGYNRDRTKYRFMHDGRKITLFKRERSPFWYFRALGANRQETIKSAETADLRAARQHAITQRKEAASERWEDRETAEARKKRSDYATIGAIIHAYKGNILLFKRIEDLTIRGNVGKLAAVVREGLKLQDKRTKAQKQANVAGDVEHLRSSVLSRSLIETFQTERRRRVMHLSITEQEKAAYSANSVLRQARSLFSKQAMQCYKDLHLPDLSQFLAAPFMAEKYDTTYRPIEDDVLEKMEKSIETEKEKQPLLWLAYKLCLYVGMRPKEVWQARPSWLVRQNWASGDGSVRTEQRWVFEIINRPDFKPKNGRNRSVPVSQELAAEIKRLVPEGAEYVINLPTPSERQNFVEDKLNEWVRPFLPGRVKGSYNLRKHFGSVIARTYGLETAQYQLGHSSIKTTEAHYASYLQSLDTKAITQKDMLPIMRIKATETDPLAELMQKVAAERAEKSLAAGDAQTSMGRLIGALKLRSGQSYKLRDLLWSLYNGKPTPLIELLELDWPIRKDLCQVLLGFGYQEKKADGTWAGFFYDEMRQALEQAGQFDWFSEAA